MPPRSSKHGATLRANSLPHSKLSASIESCPAAGSFLLPPSVIVVSALVGGLFGPSAVATKDRMPDYRSYTAALGAIEAGYIDKVESDRLVYSSITGLLQTLDPHSSFMDPRTYAQLRERQQGTYYGLGISIVVVEGDITVISLFEGSPAYKTGIRRGDIIARIEGEDAKGWTSDQAVKRLKGPKGTTVHVSIRRQGTTSSSSSTSSATRSTSLRFRRSLCSTAGPATCGCRISPRTPGAT